MPPELSWKGPLRSVVVVSARGECFTPQCSAHSYFFFATVRVAGDMGQGALLACCIPDTSVLQPYQAALMCFNACERGLWQQVAQEWKAPFKTRPYHHHV